jgi:hypothetical protein
VWDRFVGPGATPSETFVMAAGAFGLAAVTLGYALAADLGWSALQLLVALLLAFDLGGGVTTNATSAAKRWYHRAGQGFTAHFGFVALHIIHPVVITALFRPGDWLFAAVVDGYLLLAALIILRVPLAIQRAVALLLLISGIVIGAYLLKPTPGLEWFIPTFYTKLLVANLVREEAY